MGFTDLQVNGYAGIDLNSASTSPTGIIRMCERLEADGTDGILATVITDTVDAMVSRLKKIAACRESSTLVKRIIRGIHIEGPFINPSDGYRGAHPADAVIAGDVEVADRLLEAGDGLVRLVTLAPECDAGLKVTRMLVARGVMVACGHSDASVEQIDASIDAGLKMFTHVGNGCPAMMARHDNIIQRMLSREGPVWFCFIADGKHVPLFTLANYLRLAGWERSIVVTDAVAAAAAGAGEFTLGRLRLVTDQDGAVRSQDKSLFLGSTATMTSCFQNLVKGLGLSPESAMQLLDTNPKRAIAIE